MDVKSAFLTGFIKEEVFVKQPPGFENSSCPNFVYKLSKELYDLKKQHNLGMKDSTLFCSIIIFEEKRLIKLFLF